MSEQVIPRKPGRTWECTDCEWQGKYVESDAGTCPLCHADIIQIKEAPHD